jgi:hypothetical protein
VFHVSKLQDVLEGRITVRQWREETLRFSSLLCTTGLELGHICQSSEVQVPEKLGRFSAAIRKLHARLAAVNAEKSEESKV